MSHFLTSFCSLEISPSLLGLPSLCLPLYPAPHPSLSAAPSSRLTEHTELDSALLSPLGNSGELAGVITSSSRAAPAQPVRRPAASHQAWRPRNSNRLDSWKLGPWAGVEDRHAADCSAPALLCPGHLRYRHIVFRGAVCMAVSQFLPGNRTPGLGPAL